MKNIVILGAGFGGFLTARRLLNKIGKDAKIILVTNREYFTFIPLVHEVAAEVLEKEDVIIDLGKALKDSKLEIVLDSAISVDLGSSIVHCNKFEVKFDYLVIALGSTTNFYGTKGSENAYTLKDANDAMLIRQKISDLAGKDAVINVIGGGATGVEVAGEIAYLFRKLNSRAKVQLIHGRDMILNQIDLKLAIKALAHLKKLDVDLKLNCRVMEIGKDYVDGQ